MPCSEKRASKLLAAGRTRVHRVMPFVIRLVDRREQDSALQPLRVKIDPGSKTTGLALVREADSIDTASGEVHREVFVLNLFELVHRGRQISETLTKRRAFRRRWRSANLRYRAPRFLNRKKGRGSPFLGVWPYPSGVSCLLSRKLSPVGCAVLSANGWSARSPVNTHLLGARSAALAGDPRVPL